MSNLHGRNWRERGVIANPAIPREQTREQQDRERAALSRVEAPFPIHSMWDCPDPDGLHCEEARRRAIARARVGIPGLSPDPDELLEMGVSAGEPIGLVEQSQERADEYLKEPPA